MQFAGALQSLTRRCPGICLMMLIDIVFVIARFKDHTTLLPATYSVDRHQPHGLRQLHYFSQLRPKPPHCMEIAETLQWLTLSAPGLAAAAVQSRSLAGSRGLESICDRSHQIAETRYRDEQRLDPTTTTPFGFEPVIKTGRRALPLAASPLRRFASLPRRRLEKAADIAPHAEIDKIDHSLPRSTRSTDARSACYHRSDDVQHLACQ